MRQTNKSLGLLLAVCLGLMSLAALAQSDRVQEAIESRMEPAGEVCMAGEPCASASESGGGGESGGARSPEEIYNATCTTCHSTGAAGAPVVGNADDWADPIAKGKETLYENAINGINGMPPMGLCTDCSEEEIKATVDYMVEQSQ